MAFQIALTALLLYVVLSKITSNLVKALHFKASNKTGVAAGISGVVFVVSAIVSIWTY